MDFIYNTLHGSSNSQSSSDKIWLKKPSINSKFPICLPLTIHKGKQLTHEKVNLKASLFPPPPFCLWLQSTLMCFTLCEEHLCPSHTGITLSQKGFHLKL